MKPLVVSSSCCGAKATAAGSDATVPDRILGEADLARVLEIGRGDSAFTRTFLELLDERHVIYGGVSSPAVTRMRGALLLAVGHRALPTAALPFVLEELESAHDAWLTAIAARVLRNYPEPSASFAEPLMSAVLYIQHRDEIVRIPTHRAHAVDEVTTTAMAEVMRTIGWLGRSGSACLPRLEDLLAQNPGPTTSALVTAAIEAIRSDDQDVTSDTCCCEPTTQPTKSEHAKDISALRLQDHTGSELTFAEAFQGRPSIVVFFYTRCDNPAKCPLTMYRFGSLQRLLQQSGYGDAIGLAAITYDPEYDRPDRLLQYAQSWGATPSPAHRIMRTVGDFAALSDYFELGVNFSASGIVNRHQLEAFVLDSSGRIAHAVTRRRWDEQELMNLAVALQPRLPLAEIPRV
jgi:protein SCO1